MKELIFDPNQADLFSVLKPYELRALRLLWQNPKIKLNSRQVWTQVNEGWDRTVSRASIINFLNRMAGLGYLEVVEVSGKGGYHGVYSSTLDEKECLGVIARRLVDEIESRMLSQ